MLERRDFDTGTWVRLTEHIESRLRAHRADLERPQTDDNTSRILRGRISELKELLRLPDQAAPANDAGPE